MLALDRRRDRQRAGRRRRSGPKTAAKWIAQYGTLDNVIAHAARDSRRRRRKPARVARRGCRKGKRLLTVKMRLRAAARRRSSSTLRRAGDASGCARCTSASSSRYGCRTAARGDRDLGGAARRCRRGGGDGPTPTAESAVPAADPPRVDYETVLTGKRSTRGCAAIDEAELVVVRHIETTRSIR